jgi:ribose/xylose/arabinose/galactoside ABC-type transport system permease subunit
MQKLKKFLYNAMMTLILPVAIISIFGIASHGRTLNWRMIYVTFQQSIVTAILSMAVVGHLTLGFWDFSAGGCVIASAIIGGNLMKMTNTGVFGIILFCVLMGVALSSLTGFLYNKLKVPLLVLTIGLIFIYETLPRIFFVDGVIIRGKFSVLAFAPWNFVVLGVMAVLLHVIHNHTAYGHNIKAMGGSSTIAKAAGLNNDKIVQLNFSIAGLFLGVASAMYLSESGQILNVAPLDSAGLVFSGLMAYFLSHFLARYCPLCIGLIIGAFTMTFLSNGFVALGLPATLQAMTTGIFLLVLLAYSANEARFLKWREDKKRAKELNATLEGGGKA